MVLLAAVARLLPDDRERSADIRCIKEMAAGDASGLSAIYDRHSTAVYSLALRIVREESEAEDVVQEVFAQAWRQAGRYDARRGSVIAWLLIMTRTRAIDRLRMRQARPDRQSTPDPAVLEQLPAASADPASGMVAQEDAQRVRQALDAKRGDEAKLRSVWERLTTKSGPYEDQMFVDQLNNVNRVISEADQKVPASAIERFNQLMKEWTALKVDAEGALK